MLETAPLAGRPTVRPSETKPSGSGAALWARAAMQPARERVVGVERREDPRLVTGRGAARRASASMWRVTPPGYVHEYGETAARSAQPHTVSA